MGFEGVGVGVVALAELGPAGCDGGAETEDPDGWGHRCWWIHFGFFGRDFVSIWETDVSVGKLADCPRFHQPYHDVTELPTYMYLVVDHGTIYSTISVNGKDFILPHTYVKHQVSSVSRPNEPVPRTPVPSSTRAFSIICLDIVRTHHDCPHGYGLPEYGVGPNYTLSLKGR